MVEEWARVMLSKFRADPFTDKKTCFSAIKMGSKPVCTFPIYYEEAVINSLFIFWCEFYRGGYCEEG